MKDDYLWDRSGEPDPEIERLERTLGRLRHRPRPLELPVERSTPRPHQQFFYRRFFPGLAVAAALVLMVLAAGTWLALRRSTATEMHRLVIVRPTPDSLVGLYRKAESFSTATNETNRGNREDVARSIVMPRMQSPRRMSEERQPASTILASKRSPRRNDEQMMREGEWATEQLMLALHFASSKLNLVQRKIQVNKASGPAS
jgi:hypothetical protein